MTRLAALLGRIRKTFFSDIPPEHMQDFKQELLEDNFLRLSVVSVVLFAIECALYFLQEQLFQTGYIILGFLTANVVLVPLIFYVRKYIKTIRHSFALAVMYAYATLTLLLGAVLSLCVLHKLDATHVYMMMVLGSALILSIRPIPLAVMYAAVYAGFALALPSFGSSSDSLFTIRVNAFVFNLLAWILGQLALRSKMSVYVSRRQLQEKTHMLEELARRDTMTGLYNHAALLSILEDEIMLSRLTGSPLSLIMTDIDDFKRINDTYGHMFGDDVISRCAAVFSAVVGEAGIVGRYGGEEFMFILPGCELPEACVLAKDIEQALANHVSQPLVSISGGISLYCGESLNDFVRLTDEKLYFAKASGKRRFVSF